MGGADVGSLDLIGLSKLLPVLPSQPPFVVW